VREYGGPEAEEIFRAVDAVRYRWRIREEGRVSGRVSCPFRPPFIAETRVRACPFALLGPTTPTIRYRGSSCQGAPPCATGTHGDTEGELTEGPRRALDGPSTDTRRTLDEIIRGGPHFRSVLRQANGTRKSENTHAQPFARLGSYYLRALI
jgi:hypothetical protein